MARLHREVVAHSDATPAHWLLLTHGIYGSGANLRGIARKLHERRRDWGVVLVDLRQHGKSEPGSPPHTIAACADDLAAVARDVGASALAGHSFGGKVALAARAELRPRQTWILDASPSARPDAFGAPGNTVIAVLELMERLPKTWARREDFADAVVAAGQTAAIGQWLAMNLTGARGAFELRLDLAALRAMLESYYATDLWPALEAPDGEVHVVAATRSSSLDAADLTRLAAAPPHVHLHTIDAGHWLHVDAPAALVELLARELPSDS